MKGMLRGFSNWLQETTVDDIVTWIRQVSILDAIVLYGWYLLVRVIVSIIEGVIEKRA